MEAQRFPADYDGIVAGMPANNWTRLMAGDLDGVIAAFKGGNANLPPAALGVLHRAALAACDANDGVADGAIENPLQCRVDPGSLACKPGVESASCLTPAQVEAARRVYDGLKDPKTGAQLYPGLAPGSEPFWVNRDPANPFPIPISHYKWLVFRNPDWDWKTFDFSDPADYDAHVQAEAKLAPILNATDPNLTAFRERGGKLLQYHGWYDQLIAPANSINYFDSVVAHAGAGKDRASALKDVQTFYRLFMMPAVAHCGGGTGVSPVRHADGARGLGRTRDRARSGDGVTTGRRRGRSNEAALSVSAGGDLQRQRRHERRRQLHVPHFEVDQSLPPPPPPPSPPPPLSPPPASQPPPSEPPESDVSPQLSPPLDPPSDPE